jgi:hypothetical protein
MVKSVMVRFSKFTASKNEAQSRMMNGRRGAGRKWYRKRVEGLNRKMENEFLCSCRAGKGAEILRWTFLQTAGFVTYLIHRNQQF